MDPFSPRVVGSAYDAVAHDYARAFGDELEDLPLDREVLDLGFGLAMTATAAGRAPGDSWVLEAGCGPAPAAGHLAGRASRVLGLDLSATMLAVAGARNPTLRRAQGDLRDLPLRDGSCSLVVAYYLVQHVPRGELGAVLTELGRVLDPQGVLALAAHLGEGDVYVDELLGHRVETFGGTLYRRDELLEGLGVAGFDIELERQRPPLAHEFDSQRLYVVARRSSSIINRTVNPGPPRA